MQNVYERMGARQSARLHEQMVADASLQPKLNTFKVLAALLALIIHATTLGLVLLAAWLILMDWFNLWLSLLGGLVFLLAYEVAPRFPRVDPGAQILNPATHREFYRLTADLARSMSLNGPDRIGIAPMYNAAFARVGLRGKRYLIVGLPLWHVLPPEERVALLAHELGHDANGDPLRGLLTGGALSTLGVWYSLLTPFPTWQAHQALAGMLMRFLRSWIWFVSRALLHLTWRESQRAEYLADARSRSQSGTAAAVSLLRKLPLFGRFQSAVQVAALQKLSGAEFFDQLSLRFDDGVPPLTEPEMKGRLDATHPPTGLRIDFVQARNKRPAFTLASERSAAVDRELDHLRDQICADLTELYVESLSS